MMVALQYRPTNHDRQRIATAQQIIKKQVKGKERKDPRIEDGDKISLLGIGAEYAAIFILANLFNLDPNPIILEWVRLLKSGRNVGQDLLGEWFGLPKDLEIKCTEHMPTAYKCFLFTRSASGDGGRGSASKPLSYWKAKLPDSFYLLLVYDRFEGVYKFICFAHRKTFFNNFYKDRLDPTINNDLLRTKLGICGYPTIAVRWQVAIPAKKITLLRPHSKIE